MTRIVHMDVNHESKIISCNGVHIEDADYHRFNLLEVEMTGIGIRIMGMPRVILDREELSKLIAATDTKTLWVVEHNLFGQRTHSLIKMHEDGDHRVWYGSKWWPCGGWILDPVVIRTSKTS